MPANTRNAVQSITHVHSDCYDSYEGEAVVDCLLHSNALTLCCRPRPLSLMEPVGAGQDLYLSGFAVQAPNPKP